MVTRILIPLDGSDYSAQVLGVVTPLARSLKASVHLLHIADTTVIPLDLESGAEPYLARLIAEDVQHAQKYLPVVQKQLQDKGIETSFSAIEGEPVESILSVAADQHCDLIAMATHGRSGIARLVIGSVTEKVLNRSTVPLLLYRPKEGAPTAEEPIRTVCLSLDGTELSEQSLPLAQDLAARLGVPMVVARVAPTYLQVFDATDPVLITDALEAMEREAQGYLKGIEERVSKTGTKVETRFIKGYAAPELVALSNSLPDSLVVMTSHGRSGIGRFVLGSVTDEIIRTSSRPVLVVRAK